MSCTIVTGGVGNMTSCKVYNVAGYIIDLLQYIPWMRGWTHSMHWWKYWYIIRSILQPSVVCTLRREADVACSFCSNLVSGPDYHQCCMCCFGKSLRALTTYSCWADSWGSLVRNWIWPSEWMSAIHFNSTYAESRVSIHRTLVWVCIRQLMRVTDVRVHQQIHGHPFCHSAILTCYDYL